MSASYKERTPFADFSRQSSRHYSQIMDNSYKYVMVFGKTGSGVSSTVNTLLGWKACKVGSAMQSTTEEIQMESRKGERMQVIDMPDLVSMDHEYKSDSKSREVLSRWGHVRRPDAALLVIKSDERYTSQQYEIYKKMREKLGNLVSSDNLIIVFTRGNFFQEEVVQRARDELQSVLQDAKMRYIALENYASDDDKEEAVCRLLTMVDRLKNSSAPKRMPNRKHPASVPVPNTQNESLGFSFLWILLKAIFRCCSDWYTWILWTCRFAQDVWTRVRSSFSPYRPN